VQLQRKAGWLTLFKGWSKFAEKTHMEASGTLIFTYKNGGFQLQMYREATSMEIVWSFNKHVRCRLA
jgi:hypothetical protein